MKKRLDVLDAEWKLTEKEAAMAKKVADELEDLNASIVGHHNPEQRIRLHERIKRENRSLREVSFLRFTVLVVM